MAISTARISQGWSCRLCWKLRASPPRRVWMVDGTISLASVASMAARPCSSDTPGASEKPTPTAANRPSWKTRSLTRPFS
ncbi:hypothetical protein D3C73_1293600 [compost metagenome]